jgi:hypothetical protein
MDCGRRRPSRPRLPYPCRRYPSLRRRAGYRALKSIDSYQAVKDGTADYDAGHGIGPTRAQQDREAADTYAFLLWR